MIQRVFNLCKVGQEVVFMFREFAKLNRYLDDFAVNPHLYKETLKEHWTTFRSTLDAQLYSVDAGRNLGIVVKTAQKRLTDISNTAYEYYQKFSEDPQQKDNAVFLHEFGQELTGIVENLSMNCAEHFDRNKAIPLWIANNNTHIPSFRRRIATLLLDKKVEAELITIVEEYLDCLHLPGDFRVKNWHQYEYLTELCEEVDRFARSKNTTNETLSLIKILIGHNFNSLAFYEYLLRYKNRIAGKDEEPYEEQEMSLLELLEIFEDIRPEREDGYKLDSPNIRESICGSIKRELDIIRQRKNILSPYSIAGRIAPFYFEVTGTVKESFFFIRVMTKTGYMKVKSLSNMFEFAKRHIKFKTTKEPSERYMRNLVGKNQPIPKEIAMKVRNQLAVMMHYIDTYYLKN